MNDILKYRKTALMLTLVGVMTACSDDFLEEKKNFGSFPASDVYSSYSSANDRVANLYYQLLPVATATDHSNASEVNTFTSIGWPDKYSKSTEEFGGFSIYTNPETELDYNSVYDLFYIENKASSLWGRIRNCNDVIEGVTGAEKLTEEEKDLLLGQAYFFRAYTYYQLVKIYGGVPIIDYVQNSIVGDGDGSDKIKPRSSTKDCVDFICDDLDRASSMLPAKWQNKTTDFGRITSGLAEALKGKMLLFYASPLFNRADEASRWEAAYEANKAALAKLDAGDFGLVYANNGGEKNAANWARLWMNYTGSEDNGNISEAVFVTLCNTQDNVSGQPNYGKYNYTEHNIRPKNANGLGNHTPTSELVDLFPMADGKKPSESSIDYDRNLFWLNRDPRFYRTFAFPGVEWQFDDNGKLSSPAITNKIPSYLTTGKDYALWSYTWYEKEEDLASISPAGGYSPDMLEKTNHAVYVRKRTDDYHLNSSSLYKFTDGTSPGGFQQCASPLITMRYAEVLLNFAEAAAGAGHYDEAVQALQKIRARVGYTADNNYGLDASISGDRAKLLSAILYERQIELAYEGKRFDDMRRWMLFDGGVDQSSIKASWALTGFGGNTCTYLGVKPLNGTKRHQIIMYYTKSGVAEDKTKDPLLALRPKALTLDEDMSYDASTGTYANNDVKALAEFYYNNLLRKDTNLDGNDDALTITFLPKYYFIGLRYNAMYNNVTLHQTVGWHDYSRNADGLFDPLADTAPAE